MNKRPIVLFYLSFLFLVAGIDKAIAQIPVIQWEECLGGSGEDQAWTGQITADGGYIIAGFTNSIDDSEVTGLNGGDDYWVVKLSSSGNIQWEKCLGGSLSDLACSIIQTGDKGFIVAGYSNSTNGEVSGNHGGFDYWIVKLSDSGAIQWQNSFGGSANDIPLCIRQTFDSGYIITGSTSSIDGDVTGHHDSADCWVVKLSPAGSLQWEQAYGGSRGDGGVSIIQTPDSGYIVACTSSSTDGDVSGNHGGSDIWVLKLSQAGAIQWEQSYGGSSNEYAGAIWLTTDSCYIIAGSSNSTDGDVTGNHGGYDFWVLKISASGNILWQKSLGGSSDEYAYSIQQTIDTGYIVAGTTFSTDSEVSGMNGQSDFWVVKLSPSGNLQWQKCLGGSNYDGCKFIVQTPDSGYFAGGYTSSDDSEVTGHLGSDDYWVVKLGAKFLPDTVKTAIKGISIAPYMTFSPNPVSDRLLISASNQINEILITDLTGQTVFYKKINAETAEVDVSKLPPGFYFAKINACETRKFIKY